MPSPPSHGYANPANTAITGPFSRLSTGRLSHHETVDEADSMETSYVPCGAIT